MKKAFIIILLFVVFALTMAGCQQNWPNNYQAQPYPTIPPNQNLDGWQGGDAQGGAGNAEGGGLGSGGLGGYGM